MGSTTPETETTVSAPNQQPLTADELALLPTVDDDTDLDGVDTTDTDPDRVKWPQVANWIGNLWMGLGLAIGVAFVIPPIARHFDAATIHTANVMAGIAFVLGAVLFLAGLMFAEAVQVRADDAYMRSLDEPDQYPATVYPGLGAAFAAFMDTVRRMTNSERAAFSAAWRKRRTSPFTGRGVRKAGWRTLNGLIDRGVLVDEWTDSQFRAWIYFWQLMEWSPGFADVALALYARDHDAIDPADFERLTRFYVDLGGELPQRSEWVADAAEIVRVEAEAATLDDQPEPVAGTDDQPSWLIAPAGGSALEDQ